MQTTEYWPWHFPASADVNEQLRNACAEYHCRFGQRPFIVIIPRNVAIHPIAGISVQVNAFIPETAFYFRKPGVSGSANLAWLMLQRLTKECAA